MTVVNLPNPSPLTRAAVMAERRAHRRRRALRTRSSRMLLHLISAVLAVVCVGAVLMSVGNAVGWWRTDTVLTGSMRPDIQPGDVEILRSEPASSLRVGQIVAFHPPHDQFTVTHRVIAVKRHDGLWIRTKGDANNVADPWGSVRILDPKVWVVAHVVPEVGFLSVWIRTPVPHLILVFTFILLICAVAVEAIWRA